MNNNTHSLSNQQKLQNIKSVKDKVVSFSLRDRRIFNNLINRTMSGDNSPTQQQLGEGICGRESVNRSLKRIRQEGLVDWDKPYYIPDQHTPCTYFLSDFFYDKDFQNSLAQYLPAFLKFSLFMMVACMSAPAAICTPLNKVNRNINLTSYIDPLKIYSIIPKILRTSSLTMQKKIEFMHFDEDVIEKVFAQSEFVSCYDWAAFTYAKCEEEMCYLGRELQVEKVKELRKHQSLLEDSEKKSKELISVRTVSSRTARYPSANYSNKESLKRESCMAYREWRHHTEPNVIKKPIPKNIDEALKDITDPFFADLLRKCNEQVKEETKPSNPFEDI